MKKVTAFITQSAARIFVVVGVIVAFFIWGYLHQLFSFADCGGGKPDMSLTGIVAAGFGMTACTETATRNRFR